MKQWTGNKIALLGNLPPRDVLAAGTPVSITESTLEMIRELKDRSRLMLSCGGGMPPSVPTENIQAFINAVEKA